MNIVTGCSGLDAIAIVAYLLGIKLIGQIEIDPFCNTILELRYPGVKRLRNIYDVRGDEFGAVDIFAAGIPCQPFSHAGKRKGAEDNRYLWPEAIRIIRIMQPAWVIIENVDGIGSMEQSDSETVMETETEICQDKEMVLETIRKDLEEAGYQSVPIILPACSVGAPHQRYRYFVVANRNSVGRMEGESPEQPADRREQTQPRSSKCDSVLGNTQHDGLYATEERRSVNKAGNNNQGRENEASEFKGTSRREDSKTLGNSECCGCCRQSRGRSEQESENGHSGIEVMADTDQQYGNRTRFDTGEVFRKRRKKTGVQSSAVADTNNPKTTRQREYSGEIYARSEAKGFDMGYPNVADTCSTGREELNTTGESAGQGHNAGGSNASGGAGPTQPGMGGNADGFPGGLHGPGGHQDSCGILGAFEAIFAATLDQILWPAGYGAEQYDYEPPRVATGVKNRTNRLKVLGNAIVPAQIFPILLAIKLLGGRH